MSHDDPDYELIRHAYEVLDGIPAERFDLDHIIELTPSMDVGTFKARPTCNTLACGMGWLALHPDFKRLGLRLNGHGKLTFKGFTYAFDYEKAAVKLFNLSWSDDAEAMFAPRFNSLYDKELNVVSRCFDNDKVSDKELLLYRIRRFLQDHNQPVNNYYVPAV